MARARRVSSRVRRDKASSEPRPYALAAPLARRIAPAAPLPAWVEAVNGHLFGDEGFRGNEADYYDPRNSYLNEVLDRRLGIPITLSVVYLEVARRIGLDPARGGLRGHVVR